MECMGGHEFDSMSKTGSHFRMGWQKKMNRLEKISILKNDSMACMDLCTT